MKCVKPFLRCFGCAIIRKKDYIVYDAVMMCAVHEYSHIDATKPLQVCFGNAIIRKKEERKHI